MAHSSLNLLMNFNGYGVRRVNISLDTRDPDKFKAVTRWGDLDQVIDGIKAAQSAGLKIKINMVALKEANANEIEDMIEWTTVMA